MTARDFCYWLQGVFEVGSLATQAVDEGYLNGAQCKMIRRHLALVFKHEIDVPDPSGILQSIHDAADDAAAPPPRQVYRC